MKELAGVGLRVAGKLDLDDSEVAREAWRSIKANRVSLSFGYLAVKSRRRPDGTRDLEELDIFEVSVVPHPANPATRFLELKHTSALDERDLRRRSNEIRLEAALGFEHRPKPGPGLDAKPAPTEPELRRRSRELTLEAAFGWQPLPEPAIAEPETKSVPSSAELRRKAAELGLAVSPTYLETMRAESRDLMLACLRATDQPAGKR